MDLLDELDLLDSPATDSATNARVPRDQRCPDCSKTAHGPAGALNASSWRTDAGHLVVSHCDCGRYLWYEVHELAFGPPGGLADWETLTTLDDGTLFIKPLGPCYTANLPPRPAERWVPAAGFPYRPKPGADDAATARWHSHLERVRAAQRDHEPPSGTPGPSQARPAPTRKRTLRTDGTPAAGP
ncbi:hypothetical protein APR04_004080 [Promicromonospora umidemergens]|uniref:Uncharacterized protein n=1 Tax=Promicromonospora umidemergens TaxID=629679 RepID=A0ABP8XU07_9MICO|nr:hypothetical protein [Promicromonospora umidemergens]